MQKRGALTCRTIRPGRATLTALGLFASALALAGCAAVGDSALSQAFVDPAKYSLYDCKKLATERKVHEALIADNKRLMDKAETGAGGALVAEIAYRNDYINLRAQQRLADEAWRRNGCDAPQPATPTPTPSR